MCIRDSLQEAHLGRGDAGEFDFEGGYDLADAQPARRAGGGDGAGARARIGHEDDGSAPRRPGVVREPVLADLHVHPGAQQDLVHAVVVHEGAVEGVQVHEPVAAVLGPELRVTTGDGDVVEEDVRVRVAPHGDHVLVQQEAGRLVRALVGEQQRGTGREGADRVRLLTGEVRRDQRRQLGEVDGGCGQVRFTSCLLYTSPSPRD